MPFWNHKRLFMNKKNYVNCIDEHLCNALLVELRTLETKCDRVIVELSEVKKKIALLPSEIGSLVSSIERSALEMHEQSIMHREYVERCISGKSGIYLVGRADNGL